MNKATKIGVLKKRITDDSSEENDVPQEDVQQKESMPATDVGPELEPVKYYLPPPYLPMRYVSYVANIEPEDWSVVPIPGGDTMIKYGPHRAKRRQIYCRHVQNTLRL